MVHIINNIIDIIWLLVGLIATIVLIVLLVPWVEMFEATILLVVGIWKVMEFWLSEAWRVLKKRFRKKRRFEDINDPHSFISK